MNGLPPFTVLFCSFFIPLSFSTVKKDPCKNQFGNESRYKSKFKQHLNYKDLYELTLKVSEELEPEIMNSFKRPYDSRRFQKTNQRIAENLNQLLLDQEKSPISWIRTVFPSRYSRIFLFSKPRVILERQIAKNPTDFT